MKKETLTVPGTLDSLAAVRKCVTDAANEAGIDQKAAYRLQLAVDEVATNIVSYGYDEAGVEGNIDVVVTIDDTALTIALEDTAAKFDPNERQTPDTLDLPLEERPIGGLGVYLAINGVDKFDYEYVNNRNRNIFVMYRPAVTAGD